MCFYIERLNKPGDLSYDEINKITSNLPQFDRLLFSGGEPFLRVDLPEIIELFYKNNGVTSLSIPTNGLAKNLIKEKTEIILNKFPDLQLSLGLSLDGIGNIHDKHRGVSNNFKRLMDCITELIQMKKIYPNLRININTVITSDNINHLPELMELTKKLGLDKQHSFELIRETQFNQPLRNLKTNKLGEFYKNTLSQMLHSNINMKNIQGLLEYTQLILRYKAQFDYFAYGKKWEDFTCVAGESIAVIDHNGDVRCCELRETLGNLRDHNYKLFKILDSTSGKVERRDIVCNKCSCTHVCFFYESFYWSLRAIYFKIPCILFKILLVRDKYFNILFKDNTDIPHGTNPSFRNYSNL